MSRRHALPAEQLLIAWQSASLLLGYPDEELLGRLELIRAASHRLPEPRPPSHRQVPPPRLLPELLPRPRPEQPG